MKLPIFFGLSPDQEGVAPRRSRQSRQPDRVRLRETSRANLLRAWNRAC